MTGWWWLILAAGLDPQVAGHWEGESVCTVKDSPCHDEHVIYEVLAHDGGNGIHVDAYKVVGGEKDFMGALPCAWVPKSGELTCRNPAGRQGVWKCTVTGKQMTGTLRVDTK